MAHCESSVTIDVSADRVWEVLLDGASYPFDQFTSALEAEAERDAR